MTKKRSFMNLDVTQAEAVKSFSGLDPALTAERAGADFDSESRTIILPFVDQEYSVEHPSGRITDQNGKPASQYLAIIILHYLATADGTPLTGRWIAYRHLPGGDIYIEPFKKRAVNPFLKTFGDRPEQFRRAAAAIGGFETSMSGISMVIPVLPRVPICFVLWPGDEEISGSANILFDEAAPSYLPTEDYAHLPAILNGMMKKQLA